MDLQVIFQKSARPELPVECSSLFIGQPVQLSVNEVQPKARCPRKLIDSCILIEPPIASTLQMIQPVPFLYYHYCLSAFMSLVLLEHNSLLQAAGVAILASQERGSGKSSLVEFSSNRLEHAQYSQYQVHLED